MTQALVEEAVRRKSDKSAGSLLKSPPPSLFLFRLICVKESCCKPWTSMLMGRKDTLMMCLFWGVILSTLILCVVSLTKKQIISENGSLNQILYLFARNVRMKLLDSISL